MRQVHSQTVLAFGISVTDATLGSSISSSTSIVTTAYVMPAELYVKRSQRDVVQRLCHGFQRASASVDAEGDRTVLMPCGSLDQRILHICISYVINGVASNLHLHVAN